MQLQREQDTGARCQIHVRQGEEIDLVCGSGGELAALEGTRVMQAQAVVQHRGRMTQQAQACDLARTRRSTDQARRVHE